MALPLTPGTWSLDPAHSIVGFSVRHLGITTLRGRFGGAEASLTVGDHLGSSSLSAEVDMSSVDTGNPDRDNHLRSTEIFDVETQPKMTFASTAFSDAGGGQFEVTGDLTINGTTRSETLTAELGGTEANPLDGSTRAGFLATGSIDRTLYGIDWNVPLASGGAMLSDSIDLTLDVQLVGPAAD